MNKTEKTAEMTDINKYFDENMTENISGKTENICLDLPSDTKGERKC
jgi:hypothetical protein